MYLSPLITPHGSWVIWPISCHSRRSGALACYWSLPRFLQLLGHPSSCVLVGSCIDGHHKQATELLTQFEKGSLIFWIINVKTSHLDCTVGQWVDKERWGSGKDDQEQMPVFFMLRQRLMTVVSPSSSSICKLAVNVFDLVSGSIRSGILSVYLKFRNGRLETVIQEASNSFLSSVVPSFGPVFTCFYSLPEVCCSQHFSRINSTF